MPLLADIVVALTAGLLAYLGVRWYRRSPATPAHPAEEAARAVGEAVRPHPGLRGLVARRLDREVASGFLLTLALVVTLAGGLILGVLALLVRRVAAIQHVDSSVATWAFDHRSGDSTSALKSITDLGTLQVVVVLAIAVVLVDAIRTRNRWSILFLLAVLVGMEAVMHSVKDLVARVRPTLNPDAATLGPSFPSGHSATAAAFYAAAALILARVVGRRAGPVVFAGAVAIAVAVAASRVLLDLHWFSDVIGGLALGWAWFALCAVVFGGRLLRPTAAAELAAAGASAPRRAASVEPATARRRSPASRAGSRRP
jgi:undecaprenyl-diphosphatase